MLIILSTHLYACKISAIDGNDCELVDEDFDDEHGAVFIDVPEFVHDKLISKLWSSGLIYYWFR